MNTKSSIQVLVFMSEIKFDLKLKKIKFSVSFVLLFTIIKLLSPFRQSSQKTNIFSNHFASVSSCSACLVGITLGENSFAPKKCGQIAFKAIKHKKLEQKKCHSQSQSVNLVTVISDRYTTFKPFGQDF